MAKIGFMVSVLFVALGVFLAAIGQMMSLLVPKLGYMAYKLSTVDRVYVYDKYRINLGTYNIIWIACVVLGILFAVFFYWQGRTQE